MLALRIIILPVFIWMVYVPVSRLFNNSYAGIEGIAVIGILFFTVFLIFLFLSLLGIFKIQYREDSEEITFHHLYKSRTILTNDITGYYDSVLTSRAGDYKGIFLLLKDGSYVELTEFNVKPLQDFCTFISRSNIPLKGSKNSWYPFKTKLT